MSRTALALVVALVLAASGWSLFGWEVSQPGSPAPNVARTLDPVAAISCEQALARAGAAEVALAEASGRPRTRESSFSSAALTEVRDSALEYFNKRCPQYRWKTLTFQAD